MVGLRRGRRRTSRRSCARSTRPGCAVEALELVQPTLDDVFVEKTGRHLEGAEESSSRRRGAGSAVSAQPAQSRRRWERGSRTRAGWSRRSGGARSGRPSAARSSWRRSSSSRRCSWRSTPAAPGAPSTCRSSPPVHGFLDFQLAGAMLQSTMLAGVSAAIALALDIEIGFIDRLVAAPIARCVVRARAAGCDGRAGPDRRASWFLAIGLDLRRAHRRRASPGALVVLVLVGLNAIAFGTIGAAIALNSGSAERRAGDLPARVRDPVPVLGLLPGEPAARAGADDRRVEPDEPDRGRAARSDHLGPVASARRSRALGGIAIVAGDRHRALRAGPAASS